MTLLNPIWLWALGGLTIPVAIHLLSRKEGKTIRIGSIRFLTETSTSKFSSVRLNEIVLLSIRSLLLILIVLFLANLLISKTDSNVSQKWVVVEKGLENNKQIKKLLDSLQKNNYETHRLAIGFPPLENNAVTPPPDYYKLSEELSQRHTVQAMVIAGNTLSNFKGKRISLPENITWLSYPVTEAQHLSADSLMNEDTLKITIAYDKEFQYDRKIVKAALQVLQAAAPAKIIIEESKMQNLKTSTTGWLIWLSTHDFKYDGKLLRFRGDKNGDLLVQENKNEWFLTKRLDEGNAVEQHLTFQFMNMLFNEEITQEIKKYDNRILPNELAWSNDIKSESTDVLQAGQSADKILILLITFVFITERILAYYRKQ